MQYRHEVKHEISNLDMLILRQRLRAVMAPDSHAIDGQYEIRSLYFDNPDDKALREKLDGVSRREKYRIRMYNNDPSVIRLERKFKCSGLGYKESALLTQAHEAGRIHFIGNIEGREAISQGVDVLVTDGFTGNIFLKTMEGAASLFTHALKDMLLGSTKTKLAALLLKDSLAGFKKRFDANEVGGTALLGISQPVIKAHGSSNGYAFFNAIRQAKVVAEGDIVGDIAANVDHMSLPRGKKEG